MSPILVHFSLLHLLQKIELNEIVLVVCFILASKFCYYFLVQEICVLGLAILINNDKITLINGVGLVICFVGVMVHVCSKAIESKFFTVKHLFFIYPMFYLNSMFTMKLSGELCLEKTTTL